MSDVERCENLIVGSGEAGKYLAWTLAKAGQKTVLVERKLVGGSCPNIACLPSKNVVHSAKVASLMRRGAEFGVHVGEMRVDMKGVRERKRKMVADLVAIHLAKYKQSGAELVMGEARFVGEREVEVRLNEGGVRRLKGERMFLSVGSRSALPELEGLKEAGPLSHIEALELDHLPEHLVVLGGGYIGLEFAQALRRFGSRVTVIERGDRLAGREDADVSAALLELFKDEGVEVIFGAEVKRVRGRSGEKVFVELRAADGERTVEGTDLLVATGRTPNTMGIGLEAAGVKLDERGFIAVNERLETSAANVWAVGDCAGSPMFTHVAYDDFRIVRDNLLKGGKRTTKGRLIPYCMFTDPELGRVGMSESEAKRAGVKYRVSKIPMAAVLRTHTLSEKRGFIKALVGADDRILGFTAFGVEAGELIAVVQTAMLAGVTYTALADTIYTHPTIAEGLTVLFASPPVEVAT